MSGPVVWVVGEGGLLGSRLRRRVGPAAQHFSTPAALRWRSLDVLDAQFRQAVAAFVALAPHERHVVFWAAGTGVVGATDDELTCEQHALALFLRHFGPRSAATIFLASSAGGVWSGAEPPACETTPPAPTSAYGRSKLVQETSLREWAAAAPDRRCRIGRIANLFGGGQNVKKQQGLISQALRALLYDRPLHLYMPLDSVRDFLFVDDCAAEIVAWVLDEQDGGADDDGIRILASQREMTLACALALCSRVAHRPLRLVRATSRRTTLQPSVLRFRSRYPARVDHTGFADAVQRTFIELRARHQRGALVAPDPPFSSLPG